MDSFLSDNTTINNGKVVDNATGKTKKVMFLGWDGTRADAISNIFYDENNFDTNGYNYEVQEYSGLHKMKETGGVYLAYAGGEKGKDSEQEASTCAGFTSILTGGWHTKYGVRNANIYLYQMLEIIEQREEDFNEDWLVIVCADHGGNEKDHGYQILENRNVWVACNKKIDSKYYGKNYDGFKEKG